MGLVRAEGRRAAEVDECTPPRGLSLGVAEDEAGVAFDGQGADEAGWASLGLGAQPPVPVAPPGGLNTQGGREFGERGGGVVIG